VCTWIKIIIKQELVPSRYIYSFLESSNNNISPNIQGGYIGKHIKIEVCAECFSRHQQSIHLAKKLSTENERATEGMTSLTRNENQSSMPELKLSLSVVYKEQIWVKCLWQVSLNLLQYVLWKIVSRWTDTLPSHQLFKSLI